MLGFGGGGDAGWKSCQAQMTGRLKLYRENTRFPERFEGERRLSFIP